MGSIILGLYVSSVNSKSLKGTLLRSNCTRRCDVSRVSTFLFRLGRPTSLYESIFLTIRADDIEEMANPKETR